MEGKGLQKCQGLHHLTGSGRQSERGVLPSPRSEQKPLGHMGGKDQEPRAGPGTGLLHGPHGAPRFHARDVGLLRDGSQLIVSGPHA